jgi:hypothetical protein
VSKIGYCWTLVECEARELPSNGESVEVSLWNRGKKNKKVDKWGDFGWIWGGGGGGGLKGGFEKRRRKNKTRLDEKEVLSNSLRHVL